MRMWILLACVFLMPLGVTATEPQPIYRYGSIHHPVVGEQGMVATQHYIASRVGADILAQGGNAVDAAVAVGFSLAVVLPRAGNLGGGGFMMLYLAQEHKTLAIDYREMAPAAAHRDMFLTSDGEVDSDKSRFSHAAVGVPGTVAGLLHVQSRYGRLTRQQVMQPAIDLAERGFVVSRDLSQLLGKYVHLKNNPATAAIFYKQGTNFAAGETLVQSDLATSLTQISEQGSKAFYRGVIAEKIVADMQANEGLITMADLANYSVVEREPVLGTYRGYQIASMPPPSSGGVHLVQLLNMLEGVEVAEKGFGSAASIHPMVESMKWVYADRSVYLGDPDYVDVPVKALINKTYAAALLQKINLDQATASSHIKADAKLLDESLDTPHYSIMDSDGNAVANTYTLNFSFGSGITVPGTGILLNNEMDDFSAKPGVPNAYGLIGAQANAVEKGKRPLSSMTPTLVFKDNRPYLVTGSPGGSRIITTVLQTILNVIDHKMNIADAVSAPRLHHQWQPDKLFMEPGFSPDTVKLLQSMQHEVTPTRSMGSAQSIVWRDGVFYGAADPRKPDAKAIAVNTSR